MPLDARKARHITGNLARVAHGRTQSITLLLRKPDNSTQTMIVNAIWREAQDADPTLDPPAPGAPGSPNTGGNDDIVSIFLQTDITLGQLRSCIYAAPTTPLPSEPATRYLLTSITPKGILPGGDRYIVTWTRQR